MHTYHQKCYSTPTEDYLTELSTDKRGCSWFVANQFVSVILGT
jgi:hypothetical protein